MLLRAVSGTETFREGLRKYHMFFLSSHRFPVTLTPEIHLGVLAKQGALGVRTVSKEDRPAGQGSVPMGSWSHLTVDVPEGMVFKVFGQRQDNTGSGAIAVMLIRMREQAALRRIECNRVASRMATSFPLVIEGRFDVLDLGEAGRLGAHLTTHTISAVGNAARRQLLFASTMLDPEIAPPARAKVTTVRTHEGEVTQVTTATRKRMLDLGD